MDGRIPSPYNINLLMHRNGMYIACCVVTLEFGLFAPGDLFNNTFICMHRTALRQQHILIIHIQLNLLVEERIYQLIQLMCTCLAVLSICAIQIWAALYFSFFLEYTSNAYHCIRQKEFEQYKPFHGRVTFQLLKQLQRIG